MTGSGNMALIKVFNHLDPSAPAITTRIGGVKESGQTDGRA